MDVLFYIETLLLSLELIFLSLISRGYQYISTLIL